MEETSRCIREKKGFVTVGKVVKSDTEWKQTLEFEQYVVTREKGTEEPFSGQYVDTREKEFTGASVAGTISPLGHEIRFGDRMAQFLRLPSPRRTFAGSPTAAPRGSPGGTLPRCNAHLGHVFPDGPKPTGCGTCINSAALVFLRTESK